MFNKFNNFNISYNHNHLHALLLFNSTVKTDEIKNNIEVFYKSCLSDEMRMIEYISIRNQFIKGVFF